MEFEWHEAKRIANLAKHGLDFQDADLVFEAIHFAEPARSVGDELRFAVIGPYDGRLVAVICTMRGDSVRIISMRRARQSERQRYQTLYG
jgi:uncharacterized DUF497 family protein